MTPVTIFQVAQAWGANADESGAINGAEFERLGLPFFGGCQQCHATIAAFNACPSRTGFLLCSDCISPEVGFATAEDFKQWCEEDA